MTSSASDPNTPWKRPMSEPTEYEKRALVAAATALGVQACFNLHT